MHAVSHPQVLGPVMSKADSLYLNDKMCMQCWSTYAKSRKMLWRNSRMKMRCLNAWEISCPNWQVAEGAYMLAPLFLPQSWIFDACSNEY